MNAPRYTPQSLIDFATRTLQAVGMEPAKADCVALTLVEGDLLGHDTHGLNLLAPYVKEVQNGTMSRTDEPLVLRDKPAALWWDGQRLPGPWLVRRAMDTLMPRARDLGCASLVIKRSHHIACLAVYLRWALEQGFLMLLASSDNNSASVAPYGGTEAVFTPNPLALGYPLSDGGVMVDISASITTNNMLNRKRAAGLRYDHDVLMDAQGKPTNDPKVLSEQPPGTLLPVGGLTHGHKGYGLALLVESLTAGLSGRGRADPKEGWGATVHITLYDIDSFCGQPEFLRQMDRVAQMCRGNRPLDPKQPVRMPGDKGYKQMHEQSALGVILHPSIWPQLLPLSQALGVALPEAV
ncbi:MAG: Ldh family oxidoreductase [Alphaproteobacteria bacterium]|nr:Ldh family oxidoreductase [Alphaproteobacteria bacterium]